MQCIVGLWRSMMYYMNFFVDLIILLNVIIGYNLLIIVNILLIIIKFHIYTTLSLLKIPTTYIIVRLLPCCLVILYRLVFFPPLCRNDLF